MGLTESQTVESLKVGLKQDKENNKYLVDIYTQKYVTGNIATRDISS